MTLFRSMDSKCHFQFSSTQNDDGDVGDDGRLFGEPSKAYRKYWITLLICDHLLEHKHTIFELSTMSKWALSATESEFTTHVFIYVSHVFMCVGHRFLSTFVRVLLYNTVPSDGAFQAIQMEGGTKIVSICARVRVNDIQYIQIIYSLPDSKCQPFYQLGFRCAYI